MAELDSLPSIRVTDEASSVNMCFRGGARWRRSRRPGFRLLSGIQLDRDQTILNTYKLNRRSKKRIVATL